jgi:site-specific DNA-methyltransferase (adenine-specific)
MNGQDTALFSKASDEWSTPQWLFDLLDEEFHFDCDAAATPKNSKCGWRFLGIMPGQWAESGALGVSWTDCRFNCENLKTFWLNPPYSKIGAFMKKAYEESQKGAVVVCLIPARTDTKYWHDYVMKAQEIRFVKGRLKFEQSCYNCQMDTQVKRASSAPFPSVIVIFDIHRHGLGGPHPDIGETIEQPRKP